MNSRPEGHFLPTGALVTWLAAVGAYGFEAGPRTLLINAAALLAGLSVISLALRFYMRKTPGGFAIFFPATGEYRGISQTILLQAILLIAYNIASIWVILHAVLSAAMIRVMLAAGVISVMNLADECWIARRRRLASAS